MAPDEHTVLVLGAGAEPRGGDAAMSQAFERLSASRCDLLSECEQTRNVELLEKVRQQAIKLGEGDLTGSDPPVSLEAHLGRLYFEMNHNPIKVSTRAYFDAVTLYAWEITATTNWMMGKPGLMKNVIQSEIKAGRRVSIVTFNVDLLLRMPSTALTEADRALSGV